MEARSTYDRLLMIESEENFKATLRQVASQVSLSRRAPEVVEDMMADQPDDGQVPHSERYVY
jgi:hypothetical protein